MIKKVYAIAVVFLLPTLSAGAARADLITIRDTITAEDLGGPASGIEIGMGESLSFTHDLTSPAWDPAIDTVVDGKISLSFSGDAGVAAFQLDGVYTGAAVVFRGKTIVFDGGLADVEGMLQADGMLTVTIRPVVGSVTWISSTVVARINITSAPEPATVLLFGLGAGTVGVRALRRRRKTLR